MAIDPGRVKVLFQAAIELADPAARRAFLAREIGEDAELGDRLEALLAAYDLPPGVLDRPPDAGVEGAGDDPEVTQVISSPPPAHPQAADPTLGFRIGEGPMPPGAVIAGRYKIRQEIGEGGMGSVYLAEQTHPVKRQVVLKLIKAGMDSRTILARFESERQALALMDHPNIAKVLDAGPTEQGRPFFVMELVKGVPLTEYCDRHRLDVPARLALFRMNNLASGYLAARRLDRALPLLEETLALMKAKLSPDHPRNPHQHEQPRRGLLGGRAAPSVGAALRGSPQDEDGQVRNGPSRYLACEGQSGREL